MNGGRKGAARWLALVPSAAAMALAPTLDLTVQVAAQPPATDRFGDLYQLIARTFAAVETGGVALAALFAASLYLCAKRLFSKPKGTGLGEYLLCGFFAMMLTLDAGIRFGGTVRLLYQNGFQLVKTAIALCGWYFICLTLLRSLAALLDGGGRLAMPAARHGHPFAAPFAILCATWLAPIIIKYPGTLMWDSYLQIKQFLGELAPNTAHPPFGTVLYGLVAWLGAAVGNKNAVYFSFTLIQCLAYIAILSASLCRMEKRGAPRWVWLTALIIYAVSPCYVGWATVIAKDTMFVMLCLALMLLLTELACDAAVFWRSRAMVALLCANLTLLMLCRHNGALIAAPVLLAAAFMPDMRGDKRRYIRLALCAALSAGLCVGTNAFITGRLGASAAYMPDVLSLPFQQTARVVKLHGAELPADEAEAIDAVLDYKSIGENYNEWYADAVKDTYCRSATAEDRRAYLAVWLGQLARYPIDYIDATLHMNGVMFDFERNRPMYICLSDMEISDYVYPYAFNDMTMYEREPLVPLAGAQLALTELYMDFHKLPLVGMIANMGFCNMAMLALCYLSWTGGRRRALLIWLPALVTAAGCLLSPVVYLRYLLPVMCALPIGVGAYYACAPRVTAVGEPPEESWRAASAAD